MRDKANRDKGFLGTRFRKFPTYHLLKKINLAAPSFIIHYFFSLLSFFLSTNTFLFAHFLATTVLWTSVPVAVLINSALSLLLNDFLPLFPFCLLQNVPFAFFLFTHKATSHTGDFYRAFFSGIAFSCCPPFRFSGIKQRFLPRKFWCRKVYLIHAIIAFLHVLLYNGLVFSRLSSAASFPSIIPFCPRFFQPFLLLFLIFFALIISFKCRCFYYPYQFFHR